MFFSPCFKDVNIKYSVGRDASLMQSAVSAEEQLFFLILKGAEVEIVDNARSEILAKFTSLV